jgi:hypothetical protein
MKKLCSNNELDIHVLHSGDQWFVEFSVANPQFLRGRICNCVNRQVKKSSYNEHHEFLLTLFD